MAESLRHRGPDGAGVWVDPATGVALAHRRLAIVDLSPAAGQPMVSRSGRWMLVCNGEIYNFVELRRELQAIGSTFRTHSDTEVLLTAVEEWGLHQALHRSVGMFALALWDRQDRVLYLARDRIGEKPLYYGWVNGTFLFGSELKALKAYRDWRPQVDRASLALLFRHNYIPAPFSVYKDVNKLMPGTILRVSATESPDTTLSRYWSLHDVVDRGAQHAFGASSAMAEEHLDKLLREAVRNQMVADVPVGTFLSGGIDSSTVAALMQAQSRRPVRTYTVGFTESAYDESKHARAVAQHLGTEHTDIHLLPEDALDVVMKLPKLYDEPFSDSSQIATYVVACLARQHVKVVLSGDGADESFGGYDRYFLARLLRRKYGWLPPALRTLAAYAVTQVSPAAWDRTFAFSSRLLPSGFLRGWSGDRMHKAAELLQARDVDVLYRRLISHWDRPPVKYEPSGSEANSAERAGGGEDAAHMMLLDSTTYLPDDILVKLDRASMGVGLETRTPFLDHRVIEFAWALPLNLKISPGGGKWLLREVLNRYVPKALVERPKMGFGVPLAGWLRGPLREWAEALLDPERISAEGYLVVAPIQQKWREHLTGARNWQYHLWDALMVQAWLEQERASYRTIEIAARADARHRTHRQKEVPA